MAWAWAEQLRNGGLVLVDVKRGTHAGNLALLRRYANRLEGRFLPTWATFMTIRDTDAAPPRRAGVTVQPEQGERSVTLLDPAPWVAVVPWFLASSRLPRTLLFGYRGRTDTGAPEWAVLTGGDGSWCAVQMQPDKHEQREVREHGPVRIWAQFERTYAEWAALGQPGWDRLGLTVTPDGSHRVWLDSPDGPHAWSLPTG